MATKVDINKYLDAFPYSYYFAAEDDITLFFLKTTSNGEKLMMLDLERSVDLEDAIIACDEDFGKRSYSPVQFFPERNELLIYSDDNNTENFNLYIVDCNSRTLKQVTHTSYCGIYGISKDKKTLIFGDRYEKSSGQYKTKLYQLDFSNSADKALPEFILEDIDWEYRLGWSGVLYNTDKTKIYLRVDKENKRKWNNILEVDLQTKESRMLLPKTQECSGVAPLSMTIGDDGIFYISDIDGNENLYFCFFKDQKVVQLTQYQSENNGMSLHDCEKLFSVLITDKVNNESVLETFELSSDKLERVATKRFKGNFYLGYVNKSIWLNQNSKDCPSTLREFQIVDGEYEENFVVSFFKGDKDSLVNNTYKFIQYESFDGQKVRAYLSLPKTPIKAAVITAFYGGGNSFGIREQVLSELGIIHLSPAVRGSWIFEKSWRDQIKGDLGGNEIIDLAWGAKYLEKEFGLKPHQIGVMGGSHGGYATLRAMTIQENFNGVEGSDYPYGFGLCWAGFADLIDFYKTSSIPDWLVDMLGEFSEEKYKERSPEYFFDRLKSPLFVSHGTNDSRVQYSSIEPFIQKLKNSDVPHILHLVEGAGHHFNQREDQYKDYELLIEFLNTYVKV